MEEIAYAMGSGRHKEIHLSLSHLETRGRRTGYEVLGILTEQLVRCYQYSSSDCPFGLVDGIAGRLIRWIQVGLIAYNLAQ